MMIPLDHLLSMRFEFGPNYNFVFLAFFLIVPFHLVLVVASKVKSIPFNCSHFD